MPGPEWWTVLGSAVWTTGGAIQAYRELAVFERFYDSVLATQRGIVDEEVRALAAGTRLWQFRRRSEVKRVITSHGRELLTEEEKATVRDIDLRALGWSVVCAGGLITTAAAAVTALGA